MTEISYVIVYFNTIYGTFNGYYVFESKMWYILKHFVKNIQKYTDLIYIYTVHKCKYTKYTLLTMWFSEHRNIQI